MNIKIFSLFICLNLSAFVVDTEKNYSKYQFDEFNLVAPSAYSSVLIKEKSEKLLAVHNLLTNEFGRELSEKPTIILGSNRNQKTNGFATNSPVLHSFFYSSPLFFDDFFFSDWIKALSTHEMSHLYQMDARSMWPESVKRVVGSSLFFMPIPPFYTFPTPNLFLPSSFLEGHAVMMESNVNNGGRLFSGKEFTALGQYFLDDRVTIEELINDTLNYPYGRSRYILGSFFFKYLEEKYGHKKVSSFFIEHGNRWLYPFNFSKSFMRNFGEEFEDIFISFKESYYEVFKGQKRLKQSGFAKSYSHYGFTQDENGVLFFLSDGLSKGQIVRVSFDGKIVDKIYSKLQSGRIFFNNNHYYVSSSNYNFDSNSYLYGLYDEDERLVKGTGSKYYLAKDLYVDINKSLDAPLFVSESGDRHVCQSRAIFYEKIRCFSYKNGISTIELPWGDFSVHSPYVLPVYIDSEVFEFISSTSAGSTLFRVKSDNKVSQIILSDGIVDAVKLKNGHLIAEQSHNGVEYKFVSPQKTVLQGPTSIYSPFQKKRVFDKNGHDLTEIPKKENYSPTSSLKFAGINFAYSNADSNDFNFALNLSDPLRKNSFTFNYEKDAEYDESTDRYLYELQYNRLFEKLIFSANFSITKDQINSFGIQENKSNESLDISVYYPLFKRGNRLTWWTKFDSEIDNISEEINDIWSQSFGFNYFLHYSRSMYPDIGIESEMKVSYDNYSDSFSRRVLFYSIFDIYKETYLSFNFGGVDSTKLSLYHFDYNSDHFPTFFPNSKVVLNSESKFSPYLVSSLSLGQEIPLSLYFKTFPLSLRRMAIFSYANIQRAYEKSFLIGERKAEFGISVISEFLFSFNFPIQVGLELTKKEGESFRNSLFLGYKSKM